MKKWYFPVAMVILAAFVFLFLSSADIIRYRSFLLETQFSGMVAAYGWRIVLALCILALTLAFGRLYCAFACPAGLLQHLFTHVGRWTGISRLSYSKAWPVVPYAIIGASILFAVIGGSAFFLNPIFGFGVLMQPLGEIVRRLLYGGEWFVTENPVQAAVFFLVFILLVIVPLFYGRVFCNRLCPVGVILGWVNLLPGRRFGIIADKCVACGQCAKACPVGCIDVSSKAIESERCVECYDCVNACRFGAVNKSLNRSPERRSLLSGLGMAALGGLYIFSRGVAKPGGLLGRDAAASDIPVAPPGSGGNMRHALHCIGCQACISACPVKIIRPHNGRPVLDYRYGFCQYSCTQCTAACPTGAIQPLPIEEKQATRLARVTLHFEECVVILYGQHCGACAEVCPTHAVSMLTPDEHSPPIPDFDPGYCIGCGACFHVCPAAPRAFALTGLQQHEHSIGIRYIERDGEYDNGEGVGRHAGDDGDLTDFPF